MTAEKLAEAIRVALPLLRGGPTLGAFGIAREDCALAHIDYFGCIDSARHVLSEALAEVEGCEVSEIAKRHDSGMPPCDCASCVGEEAAAAAREKHRAAYTNVKEWAA